jgi:hypothetical protein
MAIDSAGNFNDGALRFGSQVLQIDDVDGAATDYIADSFSLSRGSNWVESLDENGRPNKQHGRPTIMTGSAALQLESAATKLPKLFAEFTAVDASGTEVDLVVSEVGDPTTNDGETKVNISFREVLN